MKTATSTEQRTESSCAFLNRPPLRFKKVLHGGKNQSRPAMRARVGGVNLHRAVPVILDRFDLNLSPPHLGLGGWFAGETDDRARRSVGLYRQLRREFRRGWIRDRSVGRPMLQLRSERLVCPGAGRGRIATGGEMGITRCRGDGAPEGGRLWSGGRCQTKL